MARLSYSRRTAIRQIVEMQATLAKTVTDPSTTVDGRVRAAAAWTELETAKAGMVKPAKPRRAATPMPALPSLPSLPPGPPEFGRNGF